MHPYQLLNFAFTKSPTFNHESLKFSPNSFELLSLASITWFTLFDRTERDPGTERNVCHPQSFTSARLKTKKCPRNARGFPLKVSITNCDCAIFIEGLHRASPQSCLCLSGFLCHSHSNCRLIFGLPTHPSSPFLSCAASFIFHFI